MTEKQKTLVALLNQFGSDLHRTSRSKGWWDDRDKLSLTDAGRVQVDIGCMALIVTEIAEAIEGTRKQCQDDHIPQFTAQEAELADAMIRILEFAAARKLRVAEAMMVKLA